MLALNTNYESVYRCLEPGAAVQLMLKGGLLQKQLQTNMEENDRPWTLEMISSLQ